MIAVIQSMHPVCTYRYIDMQRLFCALLTSLTLLTLVSCAQVVMHTKADVENPVRILTVAEQARDNDLLAQFKRRLQEMEPRFTLTSYDVMVFNGTLVILGRAFDTQMQNIPAQAARMAGASRIFNYVTLGPPLGIFAKTDDFSLNAKFRSALIAQSNVNVAIVVSKVFDDTLYLMGFATKQQALTIVDLATQIEGIKLVRVLFEYVYPDGTLIPTTRTTTTCRTTHPITPTQHATYLPTHYS